MKRILIYILLLVAIPVHLKAQVVINLNVPGSWVDYLSQSDYKSINDYNKKIAPQYALDLAEITYLKTVFDHQYNELTRVSNSLILASNRVKTFVKSSQFNGVNGYNSYGYIQKKYPIINLRNPGDIARNTIIQLRYYKKLGNEEKRVGYYVNKNNPIPEGERILLMLSTIENVIKITLEDEEY